MRRTVLTMLSVLTMTFALAGTASATGELGISKNGVDFAASVDNLFAPDMIWVPGDVRTETFYVRNQGRTPAKLTIDILGSRAASLIDTGDLRIKAFVAGGKFLPVSDRRRHRLLTLEDVPNGRIVPVTVTVAFDDTSTNESQLLSAELHFKVNLTQTAQVRGAEATGGRSTANGDNNRLLPDTGAPDFLLLGTLAMICLGAGTTFISRRTPTKGASHG